MYLLVGAALSVGLVATFRYWPIIDDALRTAAIERKIEVRLLISSWKHSKKSEAFFLKSLVELTDSYAGVKIEVVGKSLHIRMLANFFSFIERRQTMLHSCELLLSEEIRGSHQSGPGQDTVLQGESQ